MRRIVRRIEVLRVTAVTVSWRTGESSSHVATCAWHAGVRASQRESRCTVIKLGCHPGVHAMAGLAIRGQVHSDMIGTAGCLEIL